MPGGASGKCRIKSMVASPLQNEGMPFIKASIFPIGSTAA